MKDSGVEWLGEVPNHWKVLALKHIVRTPITDGPHETPEFLDSGVPFVSAEAVWDGKVHLESIRGFISEESHRLYAKKFLPMRDDIFIVKSGSTTGKIAITDFDDEFNIWSPLAAVRCDQKVAESRFIFYALGSDYFQGLVQVSWSFGTQPNIGMGILANLQVIVPDIGEQKAIATFLDLETAKIDTLISKIQNTIEKLKEYRITLISATVTGKIDVQDEAGVVA
jgi:type I restriction enzyme S subunit